ncbi:hypothetical protein chiPu_0030064, partial [Chiloscyllium punctatum]|nr:hypothetical protein [Chiloscyllium punctatum]
MVLLLTPEIRQRVLEPSDCAERRHGHRELDLELGAG